MTYGTVVTDTFTRTVASGWGNADTGQTWTGFGVGGTLPADWNVGSGVGTQSVSAVGTYRVRNISGFSQADQDLAATGSIAVMPTGDRLEFINLLTRGQPDNATYYMFRVQVEVGGALTATIFGPTGATLATGTIPGITYTASTQIRARAQSIGQIHRFKVWLASGGEPATWNLSVTDGGLTLAGWCGIRAGIGASNTNTLPVVFSFDNFNSVLLKTYPGDFPNGLPIQVLMAFGANVAASSSTWSWTDVTADVLIAGSIVVNPMGRQDETSDASSAGVQFNMKNTAGNYSPGNPTSTYFPNVRRNTPVWVIIDPSTRFFGYVNGFTPYWNTTGNFAAVAVSANGIIRRLTQGKTPLHSPLFRAIAAHAPVAYWPMEDLEGATGAASGLSGGQVMPTRNITFAADSTEPGSSPLAQFAANTSMRGAVRHTFTGQWQVDWYYLKTTLPVGTGTPVMSVFTNSTQVARWDLQIGDNLGGIIGIRGYSPGGTLVVTQDSTLPASTLTQWLHLRLMTQQVGGNISWQWVLFPLSGNGSFSTSTFAGSIGDVIAVQVDANAQLAGMSIGHVAVFDAFNLGAADAAQTGFFGENAVTRMQRLCAEQGVPLQVTGTSTVTMGPQSVDTFINLVRECEVADGGVLSDGLSAGLQYFTKAARYNIAATITVDMAAGQVDDPFAPVDDDQRNRNLMVVTRKNGSSAQFSDDTGPLGTAAIGTYDSSQSPNFATDDPNYSRASWLVHLGTIDGLRYPLLNLNLIAAPALIPTWESTGANDRADVLNVRSTVSQHPPGTVSLFTEGYSEEIGFNRWKVAINCSPYQPWEVFAIGTSMVDGFGSSLNAGVSIGATSMSVKTTAGLPLWTTTATFPTDFPILLLVAGWQVRVTAISGASSPQTFTIDPAPGALPINSVVSLWHPDVIAE